VHKPPKTGGEPLQPPISVGNGHPSILAERARRDFDANGRLMALEFAVINHLDNPINRGAIESGLDDFVRGTILFNICLKNQIKDRIGG
jgi:hypothetical protein